MASLRLLLRNKTALLMNVWKDNSAAWPVANPVMTCASLSSSRFPSNFVADPFLYAQFDNRSYGILDIDEVRIEWADTVQGYMHV